MTSRPDEEDDWLRPDIPEDIAAATIPDDTQWAEEDDSLRWINVSSIAHRGAGLMGRRRHG